MKLLEKIFILTAKRRRGVGVECLEDDSDRWEKLSRLGR